MMAIVAENVSKRFSIGALRNRSYGTLRESITDAVGVCWRRIQRLRNRTKASEPTTDLWALKEICFEIRHGEAVGIIGRNGAGKSTLLKVLSQITPPTEGQITIEGRIGSLLEVGTGFHPELTGSENIYLNGESSG